MHGVFQGQASRVFKQGQRIPRGIDLLRLMGSQQAHRQHQGPQNPIFGTLKGQAIIIAG